MNIDDVKSLLKDWVHKGRELKANYLLVILQKTTQKYYPHYIFDEDIDAAWIKISSKNEQPMISFNLNKKVFGVDNIS